MSVTVYSPGSAPTLPAYWPDNPANGDDLGTSFSDFVGSGGSSSNNPPLNTWYLAVADLPGTVESRRDGNHVHDQLVFTAVGGETVVSFTATAPVTPSSLYITSVPFNRNTFDPNNAAGTYPMLAADSGGQQVPAFFGSFVIVSGNLTATLNTGGTSFAAGREYTFSGSTLEPWLRGLVISIDDNGGNAPGGTVLAHFVGTIPVDYSTASGFHGYITPNTSPNLDGAAAPFTAGSGTINYLTGQVSIPCTALSPGDKFYATYGVRHSNFLSGNQPWTNLSALQAGSGSAQINSLLPSTYDPIFGEYFFDNSEWLVCRNFGYNLPSNATIQHVAFAWSGQGSATRDVTSLYLQSLALLVNNSLRTSPFTQVNGDLADNYYGNLGVNDFFPENGVNWVGANTAGTEYGGSDYYDNFYYGEDSTNQFVGFTGNSSITGTNGNTITPADVNGSGFGFGIAANYGSPNGATYANGGVANVAVSAVRMMVWYTLPPVALSVSPDSLAFSNRVWAYRPAVADGIGNDGTAYAQTLSVQASGSWSVQSAPSWLLIQPSSGSGNTDVTVNLLDKGLPRGGVLNLIKQGVYSGTIVFTDGSGTASINVQYTVGWGSPVAV